MIFYLLKEKGNIKKAYKMYKASKKIKQQDLFSPEFYLKKYPNIKDARISPLNHYLYHGYKEGKQPGKLFDNNYYLKQNPDVKESGENPLVHYVLYGKREGRLPIKYTNNKEINKLNKRIKSYKKTIDRQDRQIQRIRKNLANQFSILDAYQKLFNDLYIYHETTPKGPLKDIQELCIELLLFFDKVCEKYDIQYWLDYGTLLGPVRHGGFLPWDDDIDLGMMKSDFDRFIEVMDNEITEHGLDDVMIIREKKKYDESITGFIQVIYTGKIKEPNMLACLDILPYSHLENKDNLPKEELKNKISDQIEITQKEFLEKELFKKSPMNAYEKLNEIVGIVPHESDYIIPSSMNLRPNRIRIYKNEEMFPLKRMKFEQHEFLAANNEKEYLKMSYGENYMTMPKKIKIHGRMPALIRHHGDNLHEIFVEAIEKMKQINENFN